MDIATTQTIFTLAQQNLKLNEENTLLKLEIAKLNERRIEIKGSSCCGKTMKGTNCPIGPETFMMNQWYCWKHLKRYPN